MPVSQGPRNNLKEKLLKHLILRHLPLCKAEFHLTIFLIFHKNVFFSAYEKFTISDNLYISWFWLIEKFIVEQISFKLLYIINSDGDSFFSWKHINVESSPQKIWIRIRFLEKKTDPHPHINASDGWSVYDSLTKRVSVNIIQFQLFNLY